MDVLVGAVSELYQGDLHFGRAVADGLDPAALGAGVAVAHLDYGAVAVAQDLEDLRPQALVVVGAARRGRRPGMLERRAVAPARQDPADAAKAIAEAVTGYVSVDLLLEVAAALGVLPPRTVSVELEPVACAPSDRLSAAAVAAIDPARRLISAEVRRALRRLPTGRDSPAERPPAGRPLLRSRAPRPEVR